MLTVKMTKKSLCTILINLQQEKVLPLKGVDKFISESVRAAGLSDSGHKDAVKNSMNRIGGSGSMPASGGKNYADSEAGKNLMSLMGISSPKKDDKKINYMSEENKDLKKGEKEEKNVSIPKNKLDEILSLVKEQGQALKAQSKEIENLKLNGVEQTPRIAKKIKDHYCNLRKHNGKIVTGFASQVYNEWDERRKEFILYIDLQLEDETVVKKVKYLDFVSMLKD